MGYFTHLINIHIIMNFVFSSVGDVTSFDKLWLGESMNYDVYVIYYGDDNDRYLNFKKNRYIKHVEKRKGSKFQNFIHFYNSYPEIIEKYDRFFILDDDIIFKIDDINKMFDISRKYKLKICGPSFSNNSKISWNITRHKPKRILTYTNFVEVNTPLFSKDALINLMNVIDSCLIGWGIDLLYIWANGSDLQDAYAIIHCVKCINPKDSLKNNKRELFKLVDFNKRQYIFEDYARKIGFKYEYRAEEYKSIRTNNYIIYNMLSLYK